MINTKPSASHRCLKYVLHARKYWFWGFILVSILLKFHGLTKPLWIDEGWAWLRVQSAYYRNSYRYSAEWIDSYETSLFFFKLGDLLAFNGSTWLLRLPVFLCGTVAIWLAWKFGQLWRNWYLGCFLALWMAISPFKAFWDNTYRYYSIMMTFFFLLIIVCERFKRKPSLPRWLVVMLVSILASWTHIISVLLIIPSLFYLLEVGVTRSMPILRNRKWPAKNEFRSGAKFSGFILIWFLCALFASYVSLGPKGLQKQAQKVLSIFPNSKLSATLGDNESNPTDTSDEKEISAKFPSKAVALDFLQQSFANTVMDGHAWIWSLLDFDEKYSRSFANIFILGPGAHSDLIMNPALNNILAVLLLLGIFALLRRSPALFSSLLLVFYITVFILAANRLKHFVDARYYLIPYLTLLLCVVLGISTLCRLSFGIFSRISQRYAALAHLLLMGTTCIFLCCFFSNWTRSASAFYYRNEFEPLYDFVQRKTTGPVLYVSDGQSMFQILDNLKIRKAPSKPLPNQFWTYPLKNRYINYYPVDYYGLGFLDILMPYESFVYSLYSLQSDTFIPLGSYKKLFESLGREILPSKNMKNMRFHGSIYHQRNNVFVVAGRASFPLMPRLAVESNGSTDWSRFQMNLYFEIPGKYALTIGTKADNIKRIGASHSLSCGSRIAPLTMLDTSAISPRRLHALKNIDVDASKKVYLPSIRLDPSFYPEVDGFNPIDFAPKNETACTFVTPNQSMTSTPLILEFNKSIEHNVPIIDLRYVPEDQSLTPLCGSLAYGKPVLYESAAHLNIWIPLCMTDVSSETMLARSEIRLTNTGKLLGRNYNLIHNETREYRIGDYFMIGPFQLPKTDLTSMLNQEIALQLRLTYKKLFTKLPEIPIPLNPTLKSSNSDFSELGRFRIEKRGAQYCLLYTANMDAAKGMIPLPTPGFPQ